jgi:chemotaxis protein methyltransferase CheR
VASALTPQLFAIFSHLVEEVSGLSYGESDRELFGEKLAAHALDRGFDALLDYYYRLRYDDPGRVEMTKLVEALLVHETYFFRELAPLVELVNNCIEPAVRVKGRARVWSAACSTGEEPFTMAMLLDARGLLDRVEVVATDISTATIERARTGRHTKRALRDGHPVDLARRYLEIGAQGVAVSPRIREAVTFSPLNLIDGAAHRDLGLFDAILCRNVFIYFRDAQVMRAIDMLADHLAPGGLIAVGISESLLRFGTRLVCEERGSSFFYRVAT